MTDQTSPRMMLARYSPWKTTRKAQLQEACRQTGLPMRPNWAHASHETFLDAIADLAHSTGVTVGQRVDIGHREGRHNRYQTVAAWSIAASGALPGSISWNVDTGIVKGKLKGSVYRPFVDGLTAAVERAEAVAEIDRSNLHDQVALSMMMAGPVAPFCRPRMVGPGLWLLAPDGPHFASIRRFMSLLDLPLREVHETEASVTAYRALVRESLATADARYGVRIGWVEEAKKSHRALEEVVSGAQR